MVEHQYLLNKIHIYSPLLFHLLLLTETRLGMLMSLYEVYYSKLMMGKQLQTITYSFNIDMDRLLVGSERIIINVLHLYDITWLHFIRTTVV